MTNLVGLPGVSAHVDAHELRVRLRALIADPEPLVLPGVADAMGVRLLERQGFAAAYATGAGLANVQHALPDVGLVSAGEVIEHVSRLTAVSRLPILVDVDAGYGGPLSAMRTVQALERAGAAGVQIEDQEMPKRCGHFDDHTLIATGHMQTKIAAMAEARTDGDLLIVARTDARSAYDLDEAIVRAQAYVEAGADAIFVEAPRTIEELARVGKELAGTPLFVNVVEGGKTPELPVAEYGALGYAVVLYANYLMRSMLRAGADALRHLKERGETHSRAGVMATWSERQELFDLDEFLAAEARLDRPFDERPTSTHRDAAAERA